MYRRQLKARQREKRINTRSPQKAHHWAKQTKEASISAYSSIQKAKVSQGNISTSIQPGKEEKKKERHQKLGFQFIIKPNKQVKYTKVPGS